jgi:hypothetical protein
MNTQQTRKTFSRRDFLRKAAMAAPALALSRCLLAGQTPRDPRPNVIFIFSDDHTCQAIGAYGGDLAALNPTPHIDRLAREGMRFDRFYVGNSICAPSRATLLTGKHSHLHGKIDNRGSFNHDQQTFPRLLQKAGYQTAIVGKTHLAGQIQGFDYWETLPGQGSYYQTMFNTANGQTQYSGYVTDIITDRSLEWLREKRDPDKPFMLMIHHKATHRTWCPALRHLTRFDDVEIPEPETLFDDYATRGTAAHKQDMTISETMNLLNDLKVKPKAVREKRLKELAGQDRLPGGEPGAYYRMTESQRNIWDAAYDPKNEAFLEKNPTGRDLTRWKYQRYMKDYLRTALAIDEGIGKVLDALEEMGSPFGRPARYNCATFLHCTIVGNASQGISGGDPIVVNSIVYDNGASSQIDAHAATVTGCNVEGGYPGPGNIDAPPGFVTPGMWGAADDPGQPVVPADVTAVWVPGDYHLRQDSPCVDAGVTEPIFGWIATDIDGDPRVVGNRPDIGSDEFTPTPQ